MKIDIEPQLAYMYEHDSSLTLTQDWSAIWKIYDGGLIRIYENNGDEIICDKQTLTWDEFHGWIKMVGSNNTYCYDILTATELESIIFAEAI